MSKGLDLTPAIEGMGIGGSLGGMHLNAERTDQSNWVFTSQRRVSDPSTGGRYDMVVLGWEARCGNDYVSFSGRELYTATVLACAEGDLIMNTRLTVKRTQNEPQLRVSRTSKKDVTTTIQIAMTTGASNNDLETHGKEAMSWADDSNDAAVPTSNLEIRPDEHGHLLTIMQRCQILDLNGRTTLATTSPRLPTTVQKRQTPDHQMTECNR
jgi:hypothetical protein